MPFDWVNEADIIFLDLDTEFVGVQEVVVEDHVLLLVESDEPGHRFKDLLIWVLLHLAFGGTHEGKAFIDDAGEEDLAGEVDEAC